MDPNATLKEIRRICGEMNIDEFAYLTTLIESLDEWITNGGFLPSDWALCIGRKK